MLCAGECYVKHKRATECCVHTQGTHKGGKSVECGGSVVCTHKVHTREGRVLSAEGVLCVHKVHTREGRVLSAEGVLCAYTRYTQGREECCVHTQGREEC